LAIASRAAHDSVDLKEWASDGIGLKPSRSRYHRPRGTAVKTKAPLELLVLAGQTVALVGAVWELGRGHGQSSQSRDGGD
jgi:hypothetical protein